MSASENRSEGKLDHFTRHAVLILQILDEWNVMEDVCTAFMAIYAGIHLSQCDLILAALGSSTARIDVIHRLGTGFFGDKPDKPPILEEWNGLVDEMRGRLAERNELAHGVYARSLDGELQLTRSRYENTTIQPATRIIRLSDIEDNL